MTSDSLNLGGIGPGGTSGDLALAPPLPSLEHEIQNLFHEHAIAGAYG